MRQRGIAFKLSAIILAGGAVVLPLIVGYNYWTARRTFVKTIDESARTLALATVSRVEAVLRATEKIPETRARALEHTAYTAEELQTLLRFMLEDNHEIYGAAVAFEPYAYHPRQEYYAPYFYRGGGAIQFKFLGSDAYRYFSMDWYQIPKETGRAVWTEPYYDEGGGNIIMATYAVPFYRVVDGERHFMGVVTADVSLDWLKTIVGSVRILDTGYAFLISRNGMVVTHPTSGLVMNETIFSIAEERRDPQLRAIGRDMIHGLGGLVQTSCMGSEARCWLAYAPVPANGWAVGVLFPENELMADAVNLSRANVEFGVLGAVLLLIVVVWATRSMTRPLTALARASDEIARGHLDGALPPVTSADEVGRLTAAFGRMQHDLRQYINELKETAAARERAAAEALALAEECKRAERQVEEYSRTLEQKVEQRTVELRQMNDELRQTLSRLQETRQQLIVQEKLASLGALTAGIAHEIKNPLNFVVNFAELSVSLADELRHSIESQQDHLEPKERQYWGEILQDLQDNARKINEHGKRADRIVRGMLQHSRGASGERQPTDLNALVAEYVSLAYHGLRANDPSFNVTFENSYDPSVGMWNVVPQDLSRVVLNIVNNACYAVHQRQREMGNGFVPTVSVRTHRLGDDRVEIRIRDNGPGIPDSVRDRIFTPFFTTKPTGEGTGLGLSISYDIVVQQHQGELRVESEAGRFTEFIIVLPAARRAEPSATPSGRTDTPLT